MLVAKAGDHQAPHIVGIMHSAPLWMPLVSRVEFIGPVDIAGDKSIAAAIVKGSWVPRFSHHSIRITTTETPSRARLDWLWQEFPKSNRNLSGEA